MIIIGHKNPDTDSVVSAIVFSSYCKKINKKATAFLAGQINKESDFVLSVLKQKVPAILSEQDIKNQEIFLVDHNELSQSLANKKNVCGILDHHNLAGLSINRPIFVRIEPVGSTSTLVYKMIKESNLEVTPKEAGLLLAGIISDTLNLSSPTTTKEDVDIYKVLSKKIAINPSDLADKMFAIKSDFSDKSIKEVVLGDVKEFIFNYNKVLIGVAEATSLSYFKDNENLLIKTIKKIKKEKKVKHFFFGAIDIINKIIYFYPAGEEEKEIISQQFQGEKKDNFFIIKNIVSRKKDIVPLLSNHYYKN